MFAFIQFLLGYAIVKLMLPPLSRLLFTSGLVRENFRGDRIPTALGLIFPLTLPVPYMILSLRETGLPPGDLFLLLFLITGMGLLGLCDDLLKNDAQKGLRGHITELFKGNLTSGGLKAIAGVIFSLAFAVGLQVLKKSGWWLVIPHTLLVALAANSFNLFDLRPGRAVKVFILAIIIILVLLSAAGKMNPYVYLSISVLGAVFAYIPTDLKARGMLGDTGANFLGALFGGLVILSRDSFLFWITLGLLVLLHIYAEFSSITKAIERNKLLKFFDDLGRE